MWGKETMKVVGLTETECSMMHVLTKRYTSYEDLRRLAEMPPEQQHIPEWCQSDTVEIL